MITIEENVLSKGNFHLLDLGTKTNYTCIHTKMLAGLISKCTVGGSAL